MLALSHFWHHHQNWHHFCSSSAWGKGLSNDTQMRVTGSIEPEICTKMLRNLSNKLGAEFPVNYTWLHTQWQEFPVSMMLSWEFLYREQDNCSWCNFNCPEVFSKGCGLAFIILVCENPACVFRCIFKVLAQPWWLRLNQELKKLGFRRKALQLFFF